MVDVHWQISVLKASWACRIANESENRLWAYLLKLYLSRFEDQFILKTTLTQNKAFSLLITIPQLFKDIIVSFKESNMLENEDALQNVERQPFGGISLKLKNKIIFQIMD